VKAGKVRARRVQARRVAGWSRFEGWGVQAVDMVEKVLCLQYSI
jgi:hypothetical protein